MEKSKPKVKKSINNNNEHGEHLNQHSSYNGRVNYSSEIPYKNDLMVNDAVLRDFRNSLVGMKEYIDKDNLKLLEKIETQQTSITELTEKFTKLEAENNDLKIQVGTLTETLKEHKDEYSSSVQKQAEDHSSLMEQHNITTVAVSKIESDIEKLIRKHSLIMENLSPKEDSTAYEILKVFVKSLGIDLNDADIEKIHMIGKVDAAKVPRPFLVTFTCHRTKAHIYSKWLKKRISDKAAYVSPHRGQGISIREYLPALQQGLFEEALKSLQEGEDVWTDRGIVYVRKGEVIEPFSKKLPKQEDSRCSVM